MCLSKVENKPYNTTRKRWKVLKLCDNNRLLSVHEYTSWAVNKRLQARNTRHEWSMPANIGFHVLLSKADAARLANSYMNEGREVAIVELEVKGFNASGWWDFYGYELRSETWTQAKIVNVFTPSGRHNITNRFTK